MPLSKCRHRSREMSAIGPSGELTSAGHWTSESQIPQHYTMWFWRWWISGFPELSPLIILTVDLLTCGAEAAALWSRGSGVCRKLRVWWLPCLCTLCLSHGASLSTTERCPTLGALWKSFWLWSVFHFPYRFYWPVGKRFHFKWA